MKQSLVVICLLTLISFESCKKNSSGINTAPLLEIDYSGLLNFSAASLTLPEDTVTMYFTVDLTTVAALSSDLTVTLKPDTAKLNSYNALGGVHFNMLPDSCYSFPTPAVIVRATQIVAVDSVTFYRKKINSSINYMLPISIIDAQGQAISTDNATMYYHFIGNALKGVYSDTGTRTLYAGTISGGIVDTVLNVSVSKEIAAVDGITLLCDYADLGQSGWQYKIIYDGGSTVVIQPNAVLAASIQYGSFKDLGSTYDTETRTLHLRSQYTNSLGNERLVDEVLKATQ